MAQIDQGKCWSQNVGENMRTLSEVTNRSLWQDTCENANLGPGTWKTISVVR